MTRPSPRILLATALALAALLAAALPAAAGTVCSGTCRASIVVGQRPVQWVSRQSFPDKAPVDVDVRVDGRSLTAEIYRSCAARYYGRGVVVKLVACDRPRSRITIRAVTVEPRRARVRILYTAQ